MFETLKRWAKKLKSTLYALYLAYKDPQTPLSAKIVAAIVIAYALSPIDLIPDFIPVIGYLDDLLLLPLGIMLAIKLIPKEVWERCVHDAAFVENKRLPRSYIAGTVIILFWVALGAWLVQMFWQD